MSYGVMNKRASLIRQTISKDNAGFTTKSDEVVASFRCYREGRHGSLRWANLAHFSEATDLFRFRRIPNLEVSTELTLVCEGERFSIISVEDVKGKGMYIEVLGKKLEETNG